jgi:hypothetical protein
MPPSPAHSYREVASIHPPVPKQRTPAHVHVHTRNSAHSTPLHKRTTPLKGVATYNNKDKQGQAQDADNGKDMDLRVEGAVSAQEQQDWPGWMRPMVLAERDERAALGITAKDYGKRWRAAYRTLTGDAPVCGPGILAINKDKARRYHGKLCEAIRVGGWTPSESIHLYKAEKVWRKRMLGQDARFEVLGTRPGRAAWEDRERMRAIEMVMEIRKGQGKGQVREVRA